MGSLMNHRKRTIRILSSIQQVNMEVSLSRVTPKSSIYRWIFHEIHHPFGVTQIFINSWISMNMYFWLVISTILKHINQWEGLSHILWKIKHVPNHQPVIVSNFPLLMKPSTKWPLVVFPLCPPKISWIYHGYIMDMELPPPRLSLWHIKAGTKTVRTTKVSSRTLVMILETAASEVVVFKPCESNWLVEIFLGEMQCS